MAAYYDEVRKLEDKFGGLELNHVARRFNEAADELAKAASDRKPIPDGVFVSDQYKPSIRYKEPGRVGDAPPAPNSDADPGEVGNAPPAQGSGIDPEVMEIDANPRKALIEDIHTGACGHHAAPRTLIGNAFRQGFYWLTTVVDTTHVGLRLKSLDIFSKHHFSELTLFLNVWA
ncbi:uncharacterized protein LOC101765466 [Setaria italica]|uniref:uncharacterized protein LOC101765466 n=1 Tax=Setaria italica TaxID=4555 RepID=UPI0003511B1B|nr:uncharacterized protein LOC101765466 [Setaria italica]